MNTLNNQNIEVSCNICGAENYSENVVVKDREYKLLKCSKCDLMYISPQPGNLKQIYNVELDFKNQLIQGMNKRVKYARKIFKQIEKYKKRGRMLEVGCGIGPFLQVGRELGWYIDGFEWSKWQVDYVKDNLGLEIVSEDFMEIDLPENSYDLIIMWHVLEHMKDPSGVLDKARRLLNKNGLLLIAIPNTDNFVYEFFYSITHRKKLDISLFGKSGYVEHLYYFTPETLSNILDKKYFRLLKLNPDWEMLSRCAYFIDKLILYVALIVYKVTGRIGSYGMIALAERKD